MKVLHYIWSANIGGIEKLVYQLANFQLSIGAEAIILVGKSATKLSKQNKLVPQYFLNLKNGFLIYPYTLYKALKYFKSVNVIHIHTFHPILYFIAVFSGKHIVYHEHGNWVSGRKENIWDKIKKRLLAYGITKYADKIIFNSHFTFEKCTEYYQLKSKAIVKCQVVYNGVNITKEKKEIINLKFNVGTCSRLAHFKRVDRVIKAFAAFAKNKNTQLTIVGDGPLKQDLYNLCEQLNILPLVNFTGMVSDVKNYQSKFDIALLGSEAEPFGLVAIECLQLGIPVLVFDDAGGMVETISRFNINDIAKNENDMPVLIENYYKQWLNQKLEIVDNTEKLKAYSIFNFSNQLLTIYNSFKK